MSAEPLYKVSITTGELKLKPIEYTVTVSDDGTCELASEYMVSTGWRYPEIFNDTAAAGMKITKIIDNRKAPTGMTRRLERRGGMFLLYGVVGLAVYGLGKMMGWW